MKYKNDGRANKNPKEAVPSLILTQFGVFEIWNTSHSVYINGSVSILSKYSFKRMIYKSLRRYLKL